MENLWWADYITTYYTYSFLEKWVIFEKEIVFLFFSKIWNNIIIIYYF